MNSITIRSGGLVSSPLILMLDGQSRPTGNMERISPTGDTAHLHISLLTDSDKYCNRQNLPILSEKNLTDHDIEYGIHATRRNMIPSLSSIYEKIKVKKSGRNRCWRGE